MSSDRATKSTNASKAGEKKSSAPEPLYKPESDPLAQAEPVAAVSPVEQAELTPPPPPVANPHNNPELPRVPSARQHVTTVAQLKVLSEGPLTVDEFIERTGLGDNAKSYLDALIMRGLVERSWCRSAGIYSLTKDGKRELENQLTPPEDKKHAAPV